MTIEIEIWHVSTCLDYFEKPKNNERTQMLCVMISTKMIITIGTDEYQLVKEGNSE